MPRSSWRVAAHSRQGTWSCSGTRAIVGTRSTGAARHSALSAARSSAAPCALCRPLLPLVWLEKGSLPLRLCAPPRRGSPAPAARRLRARTGDRLPALSCTPEDALASEPSGACPAPSPNLARRGGTGGRRGRPTQRRARCTITPKSRALGQHARRPAESVRAAQARRAGCCAAARRRAAQCDMCGRCACAPKDKPVGRAQRNPQAC